MSGVHRRGFRFVCLADKHHIEGGQEQAGLRNSQPAVEYIEVHASRWRGEGVGVAGTAGSCCIEWGRRLYPGAGGGLWRRR